VLPIDDQPDVYISYTDTGFNEDISLISHYMNLQTFGLSSKEGSDWLDEYMHISEKEARVKKLRELHFQMLERAVVVPIIVTPYVAIVKKPWRFEFPSLYAWNYLWQLKFH